ncbi:MAG: cobalt-zinc-cadmium resistance protein [Methylotenera sp.]|nr:MAG: cobalt-zinc-cadmium resistance protein [Methylotenera sp.]PPD49878.1 MAG: cobalt-zinc-cadmium resistance protein [Methylotenera sp.]
MRYTQFLFFVLLNLSAQFGLIIPALAAENISLDEATTLALQANPDIAVAISGREVESGQALQAGARPNPTLSGQVQDLRSQNRISSIILSQQLETAGKRDKRIAAADASIAIADADIRIAQAETSAKVYAAFYQVLAAQQAQMLAVELLQIGTTSTETTAKRVLAGKVSPVEETKAKVIEAGLKIELVNANQQLAAAKKRLISLWGKGLASTETTAFTAVGELDKFNTLPALAELAAELPNSPRLKKASLAVTQKQALSEIEKSKQTPDITVSLGAQRNQELGGLTQAIIGLSIPIPLFDRNQGNLQSAKAREMQSQDEKTALENQLQAELAIAYAGWQSQIEAITTYTQDILPGAQSAFDAARKGFEFGKFSFLEVLDAQRTLFQTKTQFIQTQSSAHQAEADIQNILGVTSTYKPLVGVDKKESP